MLCGSSDKKIVRNRFDRLSTYGLLSHLKQNDVAELVDALIAVNYLEQIEIDRFRPVLQLTSLGSEMMAGRAEPHGALPLKADLVEKLRCSSSAKSASVAVRREASPAGAAKSSVATQPSRKEGFAELVSTQGESPANGDSPELQASERPLESADQSNPLSRPSHYWTWRLLTAGLTPRNARLPERFQMTRSSTMHSAP